MTASIPVAEACSCSDFRASRRKFLAGMGAGVGGAMVTNLIGDAFQQVAFGATAASPNIVVVLSLRGGADGLSMVVPHGDSGYEWARPRISVPKESLIARDTMFGLHPQFAPLQKMWDAGQFAAVHAVGLPAPNRSHFTAMEVVEDADPGSAERCGWINRLVGLSGASDPAEGVQMGGAVVPTSLYGPAPVLGLNSLSDIMLPGTASEAVPHRRSLDQVWGTARGSLGQGVRSALDVTDHLGFLAQTAPKPQNGANYPTGNLGDALLNTATIIRAQIGTRVVTIDYGSWDMHVNLGTVQGGAMQAMVGELAQALSAFFTDLGTLGNRVTVVTISEFGRRVEENGDLGLDHGYGNCMLLLGGGVKGGYHAGWWPGLGSGKLIDGDLAVGRDYRSVFADVLASRLPDISIPQVFPGFTPESIGAMTRA